MGKFSLELSTPGYQKLIGDTLGDKTLARNFVAEISTVVGNNASLQSCSTGSIVSAGLLAQTLKLSLAPTLGYAYIIPYGAKAQFQIGWKGLVQLAQRSGQYARLGVREVHDGEYVGQDEFGDDLFKFSHDFDDKKTVGYYAYFELLNGFKKTVYWTKAQVEKHAKQYSQAYKQGRATKWNDEFDAKAMTLKTKGSTKLSNLLVLSKGKLSISKYVLAIDQLSSIEATSAKSRKELVVKAINSMRSFNKQEKLMLAYLLGYSVSDTNKPTLQNFLRSLGATKAEAEELIK